VPTPPCSGLLSATVALVVGCTPHGSVQHETPAPSVAPIAALASASVTTPAAPPPASARWTQGADAGDSWTRGPGAHAPALVIRGVLRPTQPTDIATCPEFFGARSGTPPLHIALEGSPRTLHLWARARGPVGLRADPQGSCAAAGAGAWARLDLDVAADGDATIYIADVDRPGERRGQTSPYVLVVTDADASPTEEPDPRTPPGPGDVTVRWSAAPAACPQAAPYGWQCSRLTLVLGGAVSRSIPLNHLLVGQSGCWPDDTGVTCPGASGVGFLSLTLSAGGVVRVGETSESDGYCEPDAADHCQSFEKWTTFALRPGLRLVPDPAGTFPPASGQVGSAP
jgi:hypothetical protein